MFKYIPRGKTFSVLTGLTIILMVTSCVSQKKFIYFNDLPKDSSRIQLPEIPWPQSRIQKDDILEIKISGKNDITAMDFNTKSGGFGNGQAVIPQYLVDKDGEIEIYLVGKVKLEGLTVDEAKQKLTQLIQPYLLGAVVNVRLINFRFSVLGEVKLPGSYSIPNEKISVLEALGFAGDITYLGKKNNVKIYRDSAGVREIGILDFNKKEVLSSPFFYLKRNDVIYVETNTRLRQVTDAYSRAALMVGTISGLITLFYLIQKK